MPFHLVSFLIESWPAHGNRTASRGSNRGSNRGGNVESCEGAPWGWHRASLGGLWEECVALGAGRAGRTLATAWRLLT